MDGSFIGEAGGRAAGDDLTIVRGWAGRQGARPSTCKDACLVRAKRNKMIKGSILVSGATTRSGRAAAAAHAEGREEHPTRRSASDGAHLARVAGMKNTKNSLIVAMGAGQVRVQRVGA